MSSDSDILLEASKYIQRWLAHQPATKEESLTDWLLYHVSIKCPHIHYLAFSRHAEARESGADWEWWILFRRRSFRFRIQAKKLSVDGDAYASIAHTNRYGLQIDLLLSDSERVNALPFYAFYTGAPSRTMCGANRFDEGVFLGGARRVLSDFITPGRRTVPTVDLLLRTTPLSCLLGCPLVRDAGGDLLSFLDRYFPADIERPVELQATEPGKPRGVYEQLPAFVTSFVKHAGEAVPEWWEREFSSNLRGVKALLVYDLRRDDQPCPIGKNRHAT